MKPGFTLFNHTHINEILRMMQEFHTSKTFPFDKEIRFKNLAHLLNQPDLGKVWMIHYDEKIIGYIVMTFAFCFEQYGRTASVDEFFVKAPFRSQEIAIKILDHVMIEARAAQVSTLLLQTNHNDPDAGSLYHQNGFEEVNHHLFVRQIT